MDDLMMADEFEKAMADLEVRGLKEPLGDEIELFLDEQQRVVLRAEQRMVAARRFGNTAISSLRAEKKEAEAAFLAEMNRLNDAEAKARAEMEREIETAGKLAAAGRAALQAVEL